MQALIDIVSSPAWTILAGLLLPLIVGLGLEAAGLNPEGEDE